MHFTYSFACYAEFENFKYVIFDIQPIIFDRVFHIRKIFDRSEILKEKLEQSEQKEPTNQTNKNEKKNYQTIFLKSVVFEIYCIFTL